MSVSKPAYIVRRQSVVGHEGEWVKMFDPPTASPDTPERLDPTNPVPECMSKAGLQSTSGTPKTVQRDGLHGTKMRTWDGLKELLFYTWADKENPSANSGTWPGPTTRVPRGVVYHAESEGHGPPPHTIHWHGIEPTPINDGVGHCSMEVGHYVYQFQPNFIGTYFYHCHRNTVQHFEFGLYGMLLIDPPDAFFATLNDSTIPIGACRDGKFRTAAYLAKFPQFPGFNSTALDAPDPLGQYQTHPHAMTVTYDVEALWVMDDRDSVWSDLAPDARATYPRHGNNPGVDDQFHQNPGGSGFFAFNQFNADYWFVTGVPVPAHKGGTGTIASGVVVPPALNSGKSGMQVSINAKVGQTILIRCLDAAYNCLELTLPVDSVIIAWDGRAMGVPPYGQYNEPYLVPANSPIHMSVARRCDILVRPTSPISSFATAKFVDARGQIPGLERVLCTAQIPFLIEGAPLGDMSISGTVKDQADAPVAGVTMTLAGAASKTVVTDASGNFTLSDLTDGSYTVTPSLAGYTFSPDNRNVTIRGVSVAAQNFAGAPESSSHTVSGKLSDDTGKAIAGATISVSGAAAQSTVTDASGNFSLTGLSNGKFTLTPSLAGVAFTPPARDVSINGANATGQNFVATQDASTFAITGVLTDATGAALASTTVTLSGGATRTVVTDASGRYSFTGLPNGNYIVSVSLAGYSFTPTSRNVTLSGANIGGGDFAGGQAASTSVVSGTMTNQAGARMAGVLITMTGAANMTIVTDASGNYSFSGLRAGQYTLTPSFTGVTFTPPSRIVKVGDGAASSAQDFIGTQPVVTLSLSGTVTNQSGAGVAGVSVALSGDASKTAVTNSSGKYSFTGLIGGNYTVTPTISGMVLDPIRKDVLITSSNAVGVDFVATQITASLAISGSVAFQSGAPVAGASIVLSGTEDKTVVTDVSGNFSFNGLANGFYAVTPSLGGNACAPAKRNVFVNGANITGQNFVASEAGAGFRQTLWFPVVKKGPGI